MIGNKLKTLRKLRHFTMNEVAEKLEISQMSYSRYERNLIDVSTDMLIKIANLYGVSADYLLGRSPLPPKTIDDMLKEAGFDKVERTFVRFYLESNEKARKELVQAIKNAVLNGDSVCVDDLDADNIIIIPLHIGRVSAGDGFDLPDDDMQDVEFYANEHTGDADYVLQVDGDSMLPRFMDGQYVLVKKTQALDLNDIGIFAFDGRGYMKQYKGDHIHSLNPDYPDIYPTAGNDIDILGKVLGTVEIKHK